MKGANNQITAKTGQDSRHDFEIIGTKFETTLIRQSKVMHGNKPILLVNFVCRNRHKAKK